MGIITWAILVITLNILDSASTHIALHRLPENLRGEESNPLMARLMSKSQIAAEIVKQGLITALVGYCIYRSDIFTLILLAIAFEIVVANNLCLVINRLATRQKHKSPFLTITELLKLPEVLQFPVAVVVIVGVSSLIVYLVTGYNFWVG